jgi:hypothetical protein
MIPDQEIIQDETVSRILSQSVIKSIQEMEKEIVGKLAQAKSVFKSEQYVFLMTLFNFMKESRKRILPKEFTHFSTKTPKEILGMFQKTRYRAGSRISAIPKADRIDIMRTFIDPLYL